MHILSIRKVSLSGLVFALACFPTSSLSPQSQATTSATPALAPYGRCAAPTSEGVNVCHPIANSTTDAPFQVIASGTSGRGPVDHIELWADGKKVKQTQDSPFNEAITLPPGPHTLTLIEVDDTGFYSKSTPVNVTVNNVNIQQCPAPDLPGVNVCEPTPNGCNTNAWVNLSAAGKGASGQVSRMELWVGGAKIANFPGGQFNTNMIFYGTNYPIAIYEVDSAGHKLGKSFNFFGPC